MPFAESVYTKTLSAAKTTLAGSGVFQTLVGAASATAALASIYLIDLPAPAGDEYTTAEMDLILPFARVWSEEYQLESEYRGRGRVMIELARRPPAASWSHGGPTDAALTDWMNCVGGVAVDLSKSKTAPAPGGLCVAEVAIVAVDWSRPAETRAFGAALLATLAVDWGARA